MRRLQLLFVCVLFCCLYSMVSADIYVWTDEHGVKHFTNYAPPAQAQVLMRTEELPYDEEADKERIEAERQDRLVAAWQEIAEKEAQLLERQQEADQRIAEANRKAEEALQQAEALLYEAENYTQYSGRRYVSYGYYPYTYKYPDYKSSHYKRRYKHHYTHGYRHKDDGGYLKKHHPKRHDFEPNKLRHGEHHTRFESNRHFNGHRFSRGHPARFGRLR
ncbi:MAG: DUF4124 domain-containing protein [Desulfobacterales bacterium]|nr:MAG: DUF4124 domain-containing protein [Desulfobacterales bacterium]